MASGFGSDMAAESESAWKPDNFGETASAWEPDNSGGADSNWKSETFGTNDFDVDASDTKDPHDSGCRICGESSHFARDCLDKKPNSGECFNCGESGHNKAECPNPRVEREFTGNCRICEQAGHRAADCPDKAPVACRICKAEGHVAKECEVNRIHAELAKLVIDNSDAEGVWLMVVAADKEKEIEDIKQAILAYSKMQPDATLPQLESKFRDENMNTYLIAKQQDIADTHTIMNLQGEPDQKYVLSFQFSAMPRRAKFAEGWPQSKEENIARLAEAGFVMDALVTKCINCGELGHISKNCEQERREVDQTITCANCGGTGHRARHCSEARKSNKKGCRICEAEDHMAKECPQREPQKCRNCDEEGHRAAECPNERVMKCRNCDAVGHSAKECDQPRNMDRVQCRNCDEHGHVSRECPKPTDWSRVECSNCHEKGHSYKRCKKEVQDVQDSTADNGNNAGWVENEGGDAGKTSGGDGWGGNNEAGASGWETSANAATSGGW